MPIFLLDRRPILRRLGGSKGVFTEVWQGHNDGMVERIRSIGFFCFIFRTVEFWNSWVVLFFSLKWKNKKIGTSQLSKATRTFGRKGWTTSNIPASAQVATTHHASELWLATQCGDRNRFPGCFWGISLHICQTWWTSVACPSRDLQLFKCKVFFLADTSDVPGSAACHMQQTPEPFDQGDCKGQLKVQIQNTQSKSIKDIKGFRFGLFYHQWMKVLTCVSYKLREHRLVVSLFSPLLGMITYSTSIHWYSLE